MQQKTKTADYNLDIDYEWSEHKAEPVAQDKSKVNPDAECAKLKFLKMGPFPRQ